MCGITGFVNGGDMPADRGILERMTATLRHRGPDGDGFYAVGPVALGHRRLAIIDVEGGKQPMSNEDDALWITYNGELYNELDLKPGLLARGHVYKTQCDTETFLHLYEESGDDFVATLNGMFAFAIWDKPRRRLLLGRDRMGQKPLYYARLPNGGLVFGSEAKAVLAHPDVPRRLDKRSMERYFFYEYLPAPHSIWEGVAKLPRGHILVWESGNIIIRPYWPGLIGPQLPEPKTSPVSLTEASDRTWNLLVESVARHRRSDVPLGVFLSGGVDSSAVTAAACTLDDPKKILTFAIGFEDHTFDESAHARAVARHLGTHHHERIFTATDVLDLLPQVAGWLDEPFGDASVLPTHLLCRFARQEVTVALGGDGADEVLAGYPTFVAEKMAEWYQRIPGAARTFLSAAVGKLPVDHGNMSLDFKLKQFLRGKDVPPALAHQRWLGSYGGAEIDNLLLGGALGDVEAEHLARARARGPLADPLANALAMYQDLYLPEDILTKVDRASMACSLEVRAPMLDAILVDFLQALPSDYKLHGRVTKRILKRAVADKLPPQITRRPKKGFGIPVARWLRGPLSGLLDDLLSPDWIRKQALFRPDEVARRIQEHRAGRVDHRKPLWTLLMFQLWYCHWFGDQPA